MTRMLGKLQTFQLDPRSFPETHRVLAEGVAQGVAPGFVVGFWRASDPNRAGLLAAGQRRKEPSPQPLTESTIFDLASLTKILATATLSGLLVDRGLLDFEDPVTDFFPELPASLSTTRVRHLLSHTAGFAAWQPFWQELRHWAGVQDSRDLRDLGVRARQKKMRELVFKNEPEVPPDTRVLYSDLSFLLLGFILEEIAGKDLDRAVRDWIWRPMGLETLHFRRTVRGRRAGKGFRPIQLRQPSSVIGEEGFFRGKCTTKTAGRWVATAVMRARSGTPKMYWALLVRFLGGSSLVKP